MRGVLIATGETTDRAGLDLRRPLPMLPLLDRPFVQHVIECLVQQGVTEFDLVLGHMPEALESYLGDGTRWGCRFRYHLAHVPGLPYAVLRRLGVSPLGPERILLGHAHTLPLFGLDQINQEHPTGTVLLMATGQGAPEWTGWGLLTWRDLLAIPRDMREENLAAHLALTADSTLHLAQVKTVLRVTSPGELLAAQRLVLDKQAPSLVHALQETKPGIWVANRAAVSPRAELRGPLYIGPDTVVADGAVVGPHAVIGAGCIIDRACQVINSAVLDNSYIGEAVTLNGALIDSNLAFNARDRSLKVFADPLTVGSTPSTSLTAIVLAGLTRLLVLALMVTSLPVLLLTALVLALVRCGRVFCSRMVVRLPLSPPAPSLATYRLWSFVPVRGGVAPAEPLPGAGMLLLNVLPGLINVLRGDVHLVGVMPRTQAEVASLPEEWRAVYQRSKAGLFAVTGLLGPEQTPEDRFAAEAAYALNRSWRQDLRIVAAHLWQALKSPFVACRRPHAGCRHRDSQVRQLVPEALHYRADEAVPVGLPGSGPHKAPHCPGA